MAPLKVVDYQRFSAVGRRGLEPRTYGLKVRSSTIELATLGVPLFDPSKNARNPPPNLLI